MRPAFDLDRTDRKKAKESTIIVIVPIMPNSTLRIEIERANMSIGVWSIQNADFLVCLSRTFNEPVNAAIALILEADGQRCPAQYNIQR